MAALLRVIQRELHRIRMFPVVSMMLFIGPLFAFFLISMIFRAGVPRDLPVAVVDLDHSSISRKAALMVDATPIANINKNYTSLAEAKRAMEYGKVNAVLYLPEKTEKNILQGGQSHIVLYINNANVVTGSLLTSGIQKAMQTLSAGIKLQMHLKTGESQNEALAKIMPVKINSEILFNPYMNYAYFITFILLPVMLTLFTLFGTLYAIGSELHYGTTLQWLKAAGNNIVIALIGKVSVYTLIYFAIAMLMNMDLFYFLGAPIRGNVGVLVLSELLLILSYQSMAVVLITLTYNLRLSLSLASAYSMLAITYAGVSYPIFSMPAVAQFFSRLFPVSYWINVFIGQSTQGQPASYGFSYMLPLLFFIALGAFFVPRLKYISLHKNFWGKI